ERSRSSTVMPTESTAPTSGLAPLPSPTPARIVKVESATRTSAARTSARHEKNLKSGCRWIRILNLPTVFRRRGKKTRLVLAGEKGNCAHPRERPKTHFSEGCGD